MAGHQLTPSLGLAVPPPQWQANSKDPLRLTQFEIFSVALTSRNHLLSADTRENNWSHPFHARNVAKISCGKPAFHGQRSGMPVTSRDLEALHVAFV